MAWRWTLAVGLTAAVGIARTAQAQELKPATMSSVDAIWVLVAAGLVFFMQAGFLAFESGVVREKTIKSVAFKNLFDWIMVSLGFFILGFGLMFGPSVAGLFGGDLFVGEIAGEGTHPMGWTFYLFQLGFCGTAVTIVSGAIAGRTSFLSYVVLSFLIGGIIYPVFGHWAWGGLYVKQTTFLSGLGFMDFAGGTVVHSVGAWVGLAGAWIVGPRLGRYNAKGELQHFKPYNFVWATLGVLILWFGWWGFNGGSLLKADARVGQIIANTNLAAVGAGFTAFFHCYLFQQRANLSEKLLGGILGGLVAITAGCAYVAPSGALAIGAVAGVVHNYAFDLVIKKMRIDDPVGAIPVHGACGVWGTLAVALVGQSSALAHPRWTQLGVQAVGILIAFVWAFGTAFVVLQGLKRFAGLRVSPAEEKQGVSIEGGVVEPPPEHIDEAELLALLGDGK